jgi:hypothetical protein
MREFLARTESLSSAFEVRPQHIRQAIDSLRQRRAS